jgi:hypothetical protein
VEHTQPNSPAWLNEPALPVKPKEK